ncbi:hypothetical protein CPC16_006011 [Podila verticillata]|nr:hypothetical protein BGZ59_006175 [Podila verticillata]KAF9395932.1 hypothetical protein CPC16_006011 [Podila verticillata]
MGSVPAKIRYSLQVEIKIQAKIKVEDKEEEAIKSIKRKAESLGEERFQRTISTWRKPIKVSEQDEEWVKNEILQTAKEYIPWAVI